MPSNILVADAEEDIADLGDTEAAPVGNETVEVVARVAVDDKLRTRWCHRWDNRTEREELVEWGFAEGDTAVDAIVVVAC